jgi:hypothetical protein
LGVAAGEAAKTEPLIVEQAKMHAAAIAIVLATRLRISITPRRNYAARAPSTTRKRGWSQRRAHA